MIVAVGKEFLVGFEEVSGSRFSPGAEVVFGQELLLE